MHFYFTCGLLFATGSTVFKNSWHRRPSEESNFTLFWKVNIHKIFLDKYHLMLVHIPLAWLILISYSRRTCKLKLSRYTPNRSSGQIYLQYLLLRGNSNCMNRDNWITWHSITDVIQFQISDNIMLQYCYLCWMKHCHVPLFLQSVFKSGLLFLSYQTLSFMITWKTHFSKN